MRSVRGAAALRYQGSSASRCLLTACASLSHRAPLPLFNKLLLMLHRLLKRLLVLPLIIDPKGTLKALVNISISQVCNIPKKRVNLLDKVKDHLLIF